MWAYIHTKISHPELVCLLLPFELWRKVQNGFTARYNYPRFSLLSSIVSEPTQLADNGEILNREDLSNSHENMLSRMCFCSARNSQTKAAFPILSRKTLVLTNDSSQDDVKREKRKSRNDEKRRNFHLSFTVNCLPAFTLAEVLITITIIGVVAALTIPTLIKNQQNAQLKSQFQKANALVNTVVGNLVIDKAITDLNAEYCYWNSAFCKTDIYTGMNTGQKLLYDMAPYVNSVSTVSNQTKNSLDKRTTIYNIVGGTNAFGTSLMNYPSMVLSDGSIINLIAPSNAKINIVFDINGNKGPNKFGYDVFWWRFQGVQAFPASWDYGVGENCLLTNGGYSGIMCAQYALTDACPWDNTKGYWECLP